MKTPLAALLLALSAGCAHMDSAGDPTWAGDAKGNYDRGLEARDAGRYQDAVRYFEHVRNKFPYSTQAALADLAIADTDFKQERYTEAVEGYRSFLKLHPNHPQADYAQFRIAKSHYEDIPSDFILFPPSAEKDQTAVRAARVALEQFLKDRPSSPLAPEARALLEDVRRRLATHELRVARFYLRRERWSAAATRLQGLLTSYPGLGFEGEALVGLGRSYLKLGDKAKAREALQRLLKDFPQDPRRGEAERLLGQAA